MITSHIYSLPSFIFQLSLPIPPSLSFAHSVDIFLRNRQTNLGKPRSPFSLETAHSFNHLWRILIRLNSDINTTRAATSAHLQLVFSSRRVFMSTGMQYESFSSLQIPRTLYKHYTFVSVLTTTSRRSASKVNFSFK